MKTRIIALILAFVGGVAHLSLVNWYDINLVDLVPMFLAGLYFGVLVLGVAIVIQDRRGET